ICWAVRVLLRWLRAAEAYRLPWHHGALALTAAAMFAATWHVAIVGAGSWGAAGAVVLVAILAVILNREQPRTAWAFLALVSFLEFTICGLALATGGRNLLSANFGLLFMCDALLVLAVAEALGWWLRGLERPSQASSTEKAARARWAETYL